MWKVIESNNIIQDKQWRTMNRVQKRNWGDVWPSVILGPKICATVCKLEARHRLTGSGGGNCAVVSASVVDGFTNAKKQLCSGPDQCSRPSNNTMAGKEYAQYTRISASEPSSPVEIRANEQKWWSKCFWIASKSAGSGGLESLCCRTAWRLVIARRWERIKSGNE